MSIIIAFCRFQKACIKYGVPDTDLFQTTDLWDQKNIVLVTQTIFAIGRTVNRLFAFPNRLKVDGIFSQIGTKDQ